MADLAKVNDITHALACSAVSASKTFAAGEYEGSSTVSVYNEGPSAVFVKTGAAAETIVFPTTTTGQRGTIIPAGAVASLKKSTDHNMVHAICNTGGTATIYPQFTTGA
jgi:hypothetical protein